MSRSPTKKKHKKDRSMEEEAGDTPSSSPKKRKRTEEDDLDISGWNSPVRKKKKKDKQKEHDGEDVPMVTGVWSHEDHSQLLTKIGALLPKKDMMSYKRRMNSLDWKKVAFHGHSPQDCKEKWTEITKQLRQVRVTSEMLEDAKHHINSTESILKTHNLELPKKPTSATFIYANKHREKVYEELQTKNPILVSKRLTEMYKALSEKKKEKYQRKYEKELERYKETLEELKAQYPEAFPKPPPVKPLPKVLYVEDQSRKLQGKDPELQLAEAKKQALSKWSSLKTKKKIKYIQKALKRETEYQADLEEYLKENPDYHASKMNLLTKEEQDMYERSEGRPQKPKSAFGLFCDDNRSLEEVRILSPKDQASMLASLWKSLSDEKRKVYAKEAKQQKQHYNEAMEEYLESLSPERREQILKNSKSKSPKTPPSSSTSNPVTSTKPPPTDQLFSKTTKSPEKRSREEEDGAPGSPRKQKNNPASSKTLKINLQNPNHTKAPKKPPVHAYSLFTSEIMAELYDIEGKEKIKVAAQRWKAMDAEEKEKYQKRWKKVTERYKRELEEFKKGLSEKELEEFELKNKKSSKKKKTEPKKEDPLNNSRIYEYFGKKNTENKEAEKTSEEHSEDEEDEKDEAAENSDSGESDDDL